MSTYSRGLILLMLAGLSLPTQCQAAANACVTFGLCGTRVSMPVFGPGPTTNLSSGPEAVSNASAHVAWALAVPLIGEKLGGKKGKWIAGLAWIGLALVQEAFFHTPENPGYDYPSEVRTDLLTKIVPTVLVLSF